MSLATTKVIISAEDRAKAAFDSAQASLEKIKGVAAGLGLGAAFSVAGIAAFTKASVDALDKINDLSQTTKLTAETIAGLDLAADQSGTNLESLATAVSKLSVNIGKNRGEFEKLGISTKDPLKALQDIADIYVSIKDPFDQAAFAQKALGKSWQELAPLLSDGGKAIGDAVRKGQEYSAVTTENVKQAAAFNDEWAEMSKMSGQLGIRLANYVLPAFNELIVSMNTATREGGILKGVLAGLGESFDLVLNGTEETKRANRIKELSDFISHQSKIIAESSSSSNKAVIDNLRKKIDVAKKEMKDLVLLQSEAYNKKQDIKIGLNDKADKDIKDFISDPLKKKSGASGKSDIEKNAEDLARLVKEIQTATQPTQTLSEKLQTQLEAYRNIDPALQQYLQGLINQARATEELNKANEAWADQEKLNRESDERELSALEELSAAEEAHKQGLERSAQALREMIDPTLRLLDVTAEYQELLEAGLITQEEYDAALKKTAETMDGTAKKQKDELKDLQRAIEGWGNEAADVFEQLAFEGKADFSDLVSSILKDLARLAIQRKILNPLFEGLDNIFSSGDGSNAVSDFFGGFFAAGGTPPINKVSIVGEKGPELFVPKTLGTIVPNDAVGGSSYSVVVNVDASGGSVQGNSEKASELGRQIEAAVKSVLLKEKRPGGVLA